MHINDMNILKIDTCRKKLKHYLINEVTCTNKLLKYIS